MSENQGPSVARGGTQAADSAETALRLDGVTVGYGADPVLEDLSFEVPPGEFTAVIGPNGCGKSTMLRTLARTLRPSAGTVALQGRPLDRWRSREIARRLALLPQDPVVPDGITVEALVARGRHPHRTLLGGWSTADAEATSRALAATGVEDLVGQQVSGLSGGQRQRVWIAMILAQDSRIVLLDEPTSFLDVSHQIDVLHLCQDMRREGRTVVAVLHDLNQAARYADRLVVMDHGQIVRSGPPADVLDEELVRAVFELDAQITADPQSGTPMVIPRRRGE